MGLLFAPILIPLATFVAPLYGLFSGEPEGAFAMIKFMYGEFFPMMFGSFFGNIFGITF